MAYQLAFVKAVAVADPEVYFNDCCFHLTSRRRFLFVTTSEDKPVLEALRDLVVEAILVWTGQPPAVRWLDASTM